VPDEAPAAPPPAAPPKKPRSQVERDRATRLRVLRRVSQTGFLLLFLGLFFATTLLGHARAPVFVGLYVRADPLVALLTMLGARHPALAMVLPALVILVLTALAGRVFCGWICPLGTTIDVTDRLLWRGGTSKQRPGDGDTRFRRWKFYLLIAFVGAALLGLQVAYFLDPLSLLWRTLTFSVFGPLKLIYNAGLDLVRPLLERAFDVDLVPYYAPGFSMRSNWIALVMFLAILLLSRYQERFFCRNLCPLGALLGLVGRWPRLRHWFLPGCNDCGRCALTSRMGAYHQIRGRRFAHSPTECIQCFRCGTNCVPDALHVGFTAPAGVEQPLPRFPLDVGRRQTLGALAAGAAAVLTVRTNPRAAADSFRAIRPPGALPEKQFLEACTRCGMCMKVCPTNGLQPAFLEAGLEGLWTPVLVSKIGPCAEFCTSCGEVCPTGAIRPFNNREHKHQDIHLGLAQVNPTLCIAINGGRNCIVCAEVCSYKAVVFKDELDPKLGRVKRVPTVDEQKCVGCGICENKCPTHPEPAIVVYAMKEKRTYPAPRPGLLDALRAPKAP
jgi:MauM/NapG family ferredoxin protein